MNKQQDVSIYLIILRYVMSSCRQHSKSAPTGDCGSTPWGLPQLTCWVLNVLMTSSQHTLFSFQSFWKTCHYSAFNTVTRLSHYKTKVFEMHQSTKDELSSISNSNVFVNAPYFNGFDASNQRSRWSSLVATQSSTSHHLWCVQCRSE